MRSSGKTETFVWFKRKLMRISCRPQVTGRAVYITFRAPDWSAPTLQWLQLVAADQTSPEGKRLTPGKNKYEMFYCFFKL